MDTLRFRDFSPCNDSSGEAQRKPSVGCRSTEAHGGLKGPAHRDDPQVPQPIKTGQQVRVPLQALVQDQMSPQGSYPVALAGRCRTGFPAALLDPIRQAVADGRNRSLKTLKILPGPQTDHTATIRAPVPSQPEGLGIAVKIGRHKAVPPDPGHHTVGTAPVGAIGNSGPSQKVA